MKRNGLVSIILITITFSILSCGVGKTERSKGDADVLKNTLSYLVKNLDQATFSPIRVGWQYDYGFKDGWILNKYEYIRSLATYKRFQAMLAHPVFVSGPHTGDELNLSARYSFGHYNPKFVAQLHKSALVLISEKEFITTTKPLLEKYGILDFIQKHKSIYDITQKHPDEFNSIKLNFIKGTKDETWPEGAYRSMVPQMLDDSKYWNWSETGYHFWIRRDVDNTKELWAAIITDVLYAYSS